MSLKPEAINPVPAETARVAKAAFPKGSLLMRMRHGAWLCWLLGSSVLEIDIFRMI
jgi:hypothetical protein